MAKPFLTRFKMAFAIDAGVSPDAAHERQFVFFAVFHKRMVPARHLSERKII